MVFLWGEDASTDPGAWVSILKRNICQQAKEVYFARMVRYDGGAKSDSVTNQDAASAVTARRLREQHTSLL